MVRFLFAIILSVLNLAQAKAQDVLYAQPHMAPLHFNPALTGFNAGKGSLQTLYRNQWTTLTTPFQSMYLAADAQFFKTYHLGIGIVLQNEWAGEANMYQKSAQLAVSYIKKIFDRYDTYFLFGMNSGLYWQGFDPKNAIFDDQYNNYSFDISLPNNETFTNNFSRLNIGAGLMFYHSPKEDVNFFIGASADHLNASSENFLNKTYKRLAQFKAQIGTTFLLTKNHVHSISLSQHFSSQGSFLHLLPSVAWKYQPIKNNKSFFATYTGLRARFTQQLNKTIACQAIIPNFNIELQEKSTLAFAYEIGLGSLTSNDFRVGGFEIAYKQIIGNPRKIKSPIQCPRL